MAVGALGGRSVDIQADVARVNPFTPPPDGPGRRPPDHCGNLLGMPDKNTQWLLGMGLTLAVLILGQGYLVNARIDALQGELRTGLAEIRADIRSLDDRLRAVEVAFGKVEQRLETLERVILPTPAD
ncbi:MAG: hypothetical protein OXC00_08425 [Acidimicrobiaceae bacterium]|nr:hypothetical protein [Acidimicrobiaceae bacterium]